MKHKQVLAMARKYVDYNGLQGWKVKMMHSREAFGRCNHANKVISISKFYAEVNTCKRVLDTVLHEIAHALVGYGHGHNSKFMMACSFVGAQQREFCDDADTVYPVKPYIGVCSNCGYEHGFTRKPKRPKYHAPCYHKLPHRQKTKSIFIISKMRRGL